MRSAVQSRLTLQSNLRSAADSYRHQSRLTLQKQQKTLICNILASFDFKGNVLLLLYYVTRYTVSHAYLTDNYSAIKILHSQSYTVHRKIRKIYYQNLTNQKEFLVFIRKFTPVNLKKYYFDL